MLFGLQPGNGTHVGAFPLARFWLGGQARLAPKVLLAINAVMFVVEMQLTSGPSAQGCARRILKLT